LSSSHFSRMLVQLCNLISRNFFKGRKRHVTRKQEMYS
jgi:hypothetical protein